MSDSQDTTSPASREKRKVLAQLKVFWFAAMASGIFMGGVAWFVTRGGPGTPYVPTAWVPTLSYGSLILLIVASFGLMRFRMQTYKANWSVSGVEPRAYHRANFVLFIGTDAMGFIGVLVAILTAAPMPGLMIVAVSVLLTAVNWPHGAPMEATPPDLLR